MVESLKNLKVVKLKNHKYKSHIETPQSKPSVPSVKLTPVYQSFVNFSLKALPSVSPKKFPSA